MLGLRKRVTAGSIVLAVVLGGGIAGATPAHAESIPPTYNARTAISYKYIESTNTFCVDPAGGVKQAMVSFDYASRDGWTTHTGPYYGSDGWVCRNITKRYGYDENRRVKFRLEGLHGAYWKYSIGYFYV